LVDKHLMFIQSLLTNCRAYSFAALGSWLAGLLGLLLVVPILWRTAQEDRVLREQLEGYAAYAEAVRYRLFPGVW
jgi:protein-S-isoprenylcysteine O-methyltransferase Ste14